MSNHLESQEMYLRSIFSLSLVNSCIRAVDICEKMGYAKSSVSRALKLLERDGFIMKGYDNLIKFTNKGYLKAKYLDERYHNLVKLFNIIGLSESESKSTACELEHVIDDNIYEKIKIFIQR